MIGKKRKDGIAHLGVETVHALKCQFKANILACSNVAAMPWINCCICLHVLFFPAEEPDWSFISYVFQLANWSASLAWSMLALFSCAYILRRKRILPGRIGTVGRAEAPNMQLGNDLGAGWCWVAPRGNEGEAKVLPRKRKFSHQSLLTFGLVRCFERDLGQNYLPSYFR